MKLKKQYIKLNNSKLLNKNKSETMVDMSKIFRTGEDIKQHYKFDK